MKIKIALLAAIGAVLLLIAGCLTGAQNGVSYREKSSTRTSIEVTYDEFQTNNNISRDVEIASGKTIQVSLFSNPTTGYNWSENATIDNPAVLKQVSAEFIGGPAVKNTVGVGGKEVWQFAALAPGNTHVKMDYSRPWAGGENGVWTLELNVTVK